MSIKANTYALVMNELHLFLVLPDLMELPLFHKNKRYFGLMEDILFKRKSNWKKVGNSEKWLNLKKNGLNTLFKIIQRKQILK